MIFFLSLLFIFTVRSTTVPSIIVSSIEPTPKNRTRPQALSLKDSSKTHHMANKFSKGLQTEEIHFFLYLFGDKNVERSSELWTHSSSINPYSSYFWSRAISGIMLYNFICNKVSISFLEQNMEAQDIYTILQSLWYNTIQSAHKNRIF